MCLVMMPTHTMYSHMYSHDALTPLHQVASHAQKYFIRLNSMNKKDKRRSSIHDITTVSPTSAMEITGIVPGGLPTTGLPVPPTQSGGRTSAGG